MPRLIAPILPFAVVVFLVSCGNSQKNVKSQIIGHWVISGFQNEGGSIEPADCHKEENFLEDGTWSEICKFKSGTMSSIQGKWSIVDGKLMITMLSGDIKLKGTTETWDFVLENETLKITETALFDPKKLLRTIYKKQ